MTVTFNKQVVIALGVAALYLTAFSSIADGGVSIQGTRIIYPLHAKQQSITVSNTSAKDAFLVQSWTEDAAGKKSKDFVVTPPLYLSGPKNENILRLMQLNSNVPQDRESLYYFIVKAIPSVDDASGTNKSVLQIATASRIKLFVRPAGLTPEAARAPDYLSFQHQGSQLNIDNPTPYYITLTRIECDGKGVKDIMVAPKSHAFASLPTGSARSITFSTINDYGAISKAETKEIK
ncbi:fimbria/pilus periplasmic chaperone [Erwiniaceae bacterium BAC15a-03b]|uniref:Fimbria/pilus periplasmic chaperone n=1 Tax=Winslowiella arboricola TaxID=2978220 RepID=A0A9J6PQB4_9GAMM|nr:fimbria/pilus periplasmic chaperone [Winslowiella arboricola]MCU5774371.1 fimbria/pilus periplasmic chaperone [Winslowiella arboricola]MCU5778918.1 fimbria/pilus periplasmic chaperone [Winslowiella arboricola]